MDSPFLIPIVAMLIPIVVAPTAIVMKQKRRVRELEHAERMKALELGRPLPGDEPWWSPARIALAIGAGVPVGVFFCAWLATESVGYHGDIWQGATAVGVVSVICGTILAARSWTWCEQQSIGGPNHHAKPMMVDPDSFDVVGRRG